jgi:hypothetical protein
MLRRLRRLGLHKHNLNFRYIVPYKIFNNDYEFILFSIWTKDKDENNKKIEYTDRLLFYF